MSSSSSRFKSMKFSMEKEESEDEKKLDDDSSSFIEFDFPIKRNRINIVESPVVIANKPKKRIRRDFNTTLMGRKDEVFEDDEFEAYTENRINLKGYRQRYYLECTNKKLEMIKKWFWDKIDNFYYILGSFNFDYENELYNIRIVTQLNEGKRYDFFNTLPSTSINLSCVGYYWMPCLDKVNEFKNIFIRYEDQSKHIFNNMKDMSSQNNIMIKKEDFEMLLESTKRMYYCLEEINRKNKEGATLIREFKPRVSSFNSASSSSSSSLSTPAKTVPKKSAFEFNPFEPIIKIKETKIKENEERNKTLGGKKETANEVIELDLIEEKNASSPIKNQEEKIIIEEENIETNEREKETKENEKETKSDEKEKKEEKMEEAK